MASDTLPDASPPPADAAEKPASRRGLGPLRMVWRAGAAYPSRVGLALIALVITAGTTAALPWGFRQVVDKGFSRGSDMTTINHWFLVLGSMVVLLAAGTKGKRFSLPNSRILIHQPWVQGLGGQTTDIDIHAALDPATAEEHAEARFENAMLGGDIARAAATVQDLQHEEMAQVDSERELQEKIEHVQKTITPCEKM